MAYFINRPHQKCCIKDVKTSELRITIIVADLLLLLLLLLLLHLRQIHPGDKGSSFESLAKLLGGSTERDEIAFLKAKARETKQWALMSSTLLEEAKLELYTVSWNGCPGLNCG